MENIVSTLKSFDLIGTNMHPKPRQLAHLLNMIDQKRTPDEQLQRIYDSGLFADFLDGNIEQVDREEFRKALGLHRVSKKAASLPKKNEHGHYLVTVTGLNLTGEEEIHHLTRQGFFVPPDARECFREKSAEGYDERHRLQETKEYRLAIVPSDAITGTPSEFARRHGYRRPVAGVAPRLREMVSGEQIDEMGLDWLVVMHAPLYNDQSDPYVFGIIPYDNKLDCCYDQWDTIFDKEVGLVFRLD